MEVWECCRQVARHQKGYFLKDMGVYKLMIGMEGGHVVNGGFLGSGIMTNLFLLHSGSMGFYGNEGNVWFWSLCRSYLLYYVLPHSCDCLYWQQAERLLIPGYHLHIYSTTSFLFVFNSHFLRNPHLSSCLDCLVLLNHVFAAE